MANIVNGAVNDIRIGTPLQFITRAAEGFAVPGCRPVG
jgi:hypothetical protein